MTRLPLFALLALAACATPSRRISDKLVELGLPATQASCVGDSLQERLSLTQLRRLQELSRTEGVEPRQITLGQIADRLRDPGDRALVGEIVRAGVGCAL